jgi:hypothetical protein
MGQSPTAIEVFEVIWRDWIAKFGYFNILSTDNARNMMSGLLSSVCNMLNIRLVSIAPYASQGNFAEHAHSCALHILRCMEQTHGLSEQYFQTGLDYCALLWNSTAQVHTGKCPAFLHAAGARYKNHNFITLSNLVSAQGEHEISTQIIMYNKILQRVLLIKQELEEKKADLWQKEPPPRFKVHDLVFVARPDRKGIRHKLRTRYLPEIYQVLEVRQKHAVLLQWSTSLDKAKETAGRPGVTKKRLKRVQLERLKRCPGHLLPAPLQALYSLAATQHLRLAAKSLLHARPQHDFVFMKLGEKVKHPKFLKYFHASGPGRVHGGVNKSAIHTAKYVFYKEMWRSREEKQDEFGCRVKMGLTGPHWVNLIGQSVSTHDQYFYIMSGPETPDIFYPDKILINNCPNAVKGTKPTVENKQQDKYICKQKGTGLLRTAGSQKVLETLLRLLAPATQPSQGSSDTVSRLTRTTSGSRRHQHHQEDDIQEDEVEVVPEDDIQEELDRTQYYSENEDSEQNDDDEDEEDTEEHDDQEEVDDQDQEQTLSSSSSTSSGNKTIGAAGGTSTPRKAITLKRFARLSPALQIRDTPSLVTRRTGRSGRARGARGNKSLATPAPAPVPVSPAEPATPGVAGRTRSRATVPPKGSEAR